MINVQSLSFGYDRNPFLRDINFSVGVGEIFGLLGPSGAGKSTIQKILTGILDGYEGSVEVLGTQVKKRSNTFYQNIGIDFEFPCLYEKLTAKQNLAFFASLYANQPRDINRLLESVELIQDADKKVSAYSKGMKSRLSFLRALINDPKVLFLDEPTAGLDPANSRMMKKLIMNERAAGKSIILTTHNMEDAAELCDHVAFIVNGQIKAIDTPHALMLRGGAKKVAYTYIENGVEIHSECELNKTGGDTRLQKLIADGKIFTIHSCEPNLGDVFMEVTGRALV